MTQEDKKLLLKDLFGRLPHGVKVGFDKEGTALIPIKFDLQTKELFAEDRDNNCICIFRYDIFKPYLRPMSSMTEEEMKVFQAFHCVDMWHPYFYQQMCNLPNLENMFNWLNKHHFDFRGLISKELALEAPEDMYII